MRLPEEKLTVEQQLDEFDQWLTAKLERIKDTEKFNTEINLICNCIYQLAQFLGDFGNPKQCNVDELVKAVIKSGNKLISKAPFSVNEKKVSEYYDSFFNLLFLVTGATDNNLKNHFLIKLKEDGISAFVPKRGNGKKQIKFKLSPLPTTTKSDYIAKLLASCFVGSLDMYSDITKTEPAFSLQEYLQTYLREYILLILEDNEEMLQLWTICNAYINLRKKSDVEQGTMDLGRYLLNSCTIFKIRGSVSASGGHIPEDILREKLSSMGLREEVDYNSTDVSFGEQEIVENGKRKKKTRAYDFILPYKIDGWEPKEKIFIQAQFYAGDSGSVSHKVLDQTTSSRLFTLEKYPAARFVEYIDGAGYYASLRGDLEHMLTFDNTCSFIQVKSILIRLRREFQNIAYLTPVELEHAIIATQSGTREDVYKYLIDEGYPKEEVERAESISLESGFISLKEGVLYISAEREIYSRKLFILDIAANNGNEISHEERCSGRFILLPGFGVNYGILGSKLVRLVCELARSIEIDLVAYEQDIEWLLDEKVISRR